MITVSCVYKDQISDGEGESAGNTEILTPLSTDVETPLKRGR
jgi:hypothetical protein